MTSIEPWYLYVVECSDGTLYTGITKDVDQRVYHHNHTKRGAKYTRSRRPVRLSYRRQYSSHSEAAQAEWAFKKLTRKQKLEAIQAAANACKCDVGMV